MDFLTMEAAKVRLLAIISCGKPAALSTKEYQSALNDFLSHGGKVTDPLVRMIFTILSNPRYFICSSIIS